MTSYRDWVVETSSTTGTGPYNLSGSPPAGTSYFTLRQRFSNGEDEIYYWVVNADRTKWEKNRGGTLTYGTPDTLSRNVVESTNGDAAVSWVGGDAPLLIYVSNDAEALEQAISMGLSTTRPDVLKFGLWADEDGLAASYDQLKLFDGTSDDVVGVVNTVAHVATIYGLPPGYMQGMTLSRPSTTTITVAAGTVMDSTNVVGIRLAAAMTKSTAGAWAAGSGNNGMGNSLTIANTTWYHVFAILRNGLADVYLDTSVTAANKPSGTTHFCLLESIKTNGSAQLIDQVQVGNKVLHVGGPITDVSSTAGGGSAVTSTLSVPTGRVVFPIMSVQAFNGNASFSDSLYLSALSQTDVVAGDNSQVAAGALGFSATEVSNVPTNTSAQIRRRQSSGGSSQQIIIATGGWIDPRPRF